VFNVPKKKGEEGEGKEKVNGGGEEKKTEEKVDEKEVETSI